MAYGGMNGPPQQYMHNGHAHPHGMQGMEYQVCTEIYWSMQCAVHHADRLIWKWWADGASARVSSYLLLVVKVDVADLCSVGEATLLMDNGDLSLSTQRYWGICTRDLQPIHIGTKCAASSIPGGIPGSAAAAAGRRHAVAAHGRTWAADIPRPASSGTLLRTFSCLLLLKFFTPDLDYLFCFTICILGVKAVQGLV